MNITLNRLFWDNSSGIVNATVRGLGASQSTAITQPNGTNVTQSSDSNGVFVFYWAGTQNTTNFTFAEAAPDPNPPNITHLSPANLTTFENRNFTVEVNASDGIGLSEVTVDAGAAGNFTNNTALVNGSNFVKLTSLNDGNITYYTVAKDAAGNINGTAKRIVTIDTKNATLSAIVVSPISDRAATISFTADRQVNTTITYGTASGTYTTNTSNTTFSTTPKVSLTELSASTTYFYRIYTWNLASNFTESGEQNFTTAAILESGGAGGGGGPVVVTPFGQIVSTVNETIQKALNITAPKVSLLYITQDTTACWVHKVSEALPPDRPGSFDPCFPSNLYGGEAVQVAALAYFTNGSVISYTWWVSNPSLKIQPPASSLDIGLAVGAYPLGVDIAMTTGHIFSFNRSVNVVQGVVPRMPRSATTLNLIRDTVGGALDVAVTPLRWGRQITAPSLSMVTGQGAPATSGGANVWWDTLLWSNGKTDVTQGRALLLLVGLGGYVYLGQGKKPRIVGRRRR